MLPRLNFLLGLGILVLIGFYLAGAYVVVGPLAQIAPGWAQFLAGAILLAAVGLTVQFLANAMTTLNGVVGYRAGERPGPAWFISQVALGLGHVGIVAMAIGLVVEDRPAPVLEVIVIAALYLVGVSVALREWKRRRVPARTPR